MSATPAQKNKVEKVMHEFKEGDLKSSSGVKVKSRKQAVAVALSESGQSRKQSPKQKATKKRKSASTQ